MPGQLYFQATTTSRAMETHTTYKLDDLANMIDSPAMKDLVVEVDPHSPHAVMELTKTTKLPQWRFVDDQKQPIIVGGTSLTRPAIGKLKAAGVTQVTLYTPYVWELVCEQFCGQGHGTMRGQLRFVTNEEYDSFHYDTPFQPTTAPANAKVGSGQ
jgi:hypothetical protein